jgi:hypothetical protein
MKVSNFKYLVFFGLMIWALCYNALVSATGLNKTRYNLTNSVMNHILMDHVNQLVGLSLVEDFKIHHFFNNNILPIDKYIHSLSTNHVFAGYPIISSKTQNRTYFLFLSILKI